MTPTFAKATVGKRRIRRLVATAAGLALLSAPVAAQQPTFRATTAVVSVSV